jgi:hypothetical protein
MRERTLLPVLIGLWLGFTVAAWWIAGTNFAVLGPRLRNQEIVFQKIPEAERTPALRYAASELNRRVFATYAISQVVLLALVVALVLPPVARRPSPGKLAAALLIVAGAVVAAELLVTPAIVDLGREIDFLPRDPEPEPVRRFKLLHAVYVSADLVKAIAIVAFAVALSRGRRPEPAPAPAPAP